MQKMVHERPYKWCMEGAIYSINGAWRVNKEVNWGVRLALVFRAQPTPQPNTIGPIRMQINTYKATVCKCQQLGAGYQIEYLKLFSIQICHLSEKFETLDTRRYSIQGALSDRRAQLIR